MFIPAELPTADEAAALAPERLEEHAQQLLAMMDRASELQEQGKSQLALELREQMKELYPWHEIGHWECSISYDVSGQPERALSAIETALLIEPTNPHIWNSFRVVLNRNGHPQDARFALAIQMMIEEA